METHLQWETIHLGNRHCFSQSAIGYRDLNRPIGNDPQDLGCGLGLGALYRVDHAAHASSRCSNRVCHACPVGFDDFAGADQGVWCDESAAAD